MLREGQLRRSNCKLKDGKKNGQATEAYRGRSSFFGTRRARDPWRCGDSGTAGSGRARPWELRPLMLLAQGPVRSEGPGRSAVPDAHAVVDLGMSFRLHEAASP
jgi:hypothetical protein